MLLIALTAATTVSAQRKQQVNTPTNVVKTLDYICNLYGQKNSQVYSVNKNPNTGIIESKEIITPFKCEKTNPTLATVADNFRKDEPVSYQLMHLANGNHEYFRISVATGNSIKNINIRTHSNQDMWYMAVKNPENPQLRDVYAIVWENKGGDNVEGMIYMITSLRPDIYEKDMERIPTKTFTLDGRMGDDISDSLYVFYVADTYEELNRITMMTDSYEQLKYIQTNGNIFLMPVSKDRKFGITVDTAKRMGGRIRTVMPDGSLCKLWTNIDIVPGETYHITTHNSYYTPDSDYERRVGLYSGKSMFAGHDNDDVELTGGYNDTIVADTVADWTAEDEAEWHQAKVAENPLDKLTPAQRADLERKGEIAQNTEEKIKGILEGIGNRIGYIQQQPSVLTQRKAMESLDSYFEELMKLNTQFDKQAMDVVNTAMSYGFPQSKLPEAYKELLDEISKQNKMFNELYKHFGGLSKKATKCQKHINKLMEKYMNEITRLI